ncbi:MAG TPA: 4-hydroxythreonine-4-phosphate dehydrogenase PdxA, partial [Glaciecola sp.]|nr:4-hydroxythreonine-4-phosphate dehydrogenase PdxA [Glaciecola sp.]
MNALSKIAVTPGEPAGIGPDLIVELAHHSWDAILVIYADQDMLAERAALLNIELALIPYTGQTTKAPMGSLYVHHIPCD